MLTAAVKIEKCLPVMRFKIFALLIVFIAPAMLHAQREKLSPEDLAYVEKNWPQAKMTGTGLRSFVVQSGTGEKPVPGDEITVLYKGMLMNGTVFDQTPDAAHAFTFRLGRGMVIEGWEEGLQLMQVGEKRTFIIPFELAYGTRGDAPRIPRRAALVFDVQLIKLVKQDAKAKIENTPIDPNAKRVKDTTVTNMPAVHD